MSRLDKALRTVYDELRMQEIVFTQIPDTFYEYYYAENRLYLLRDRMDGSLMIERGGNPQDALRNGISRKSKILRGTNPLPSYEEEMSDAQNY